jgi:IS5 family transposase
MGCGAGDDALVEAGGLTGTAAISGRDYRRLAKKRAHAIQHSRGKEQKAKLYRELIAATRATKAALERALVLLGVCAGPAAAGWCREVRHYLPLIERVMTQTRRRVFDGEAVPAGEKVVSLFERTPTSSSKAAARCNTVTRSI